MNPVSGSRTTQILTMMLELTFSLRLLTKKKIKCLVKTVICKGLQACMEDRCQKVAIKVNKTEVVTNMV